MARFENAVTYLITSGYVKYIEMGDFPGCLSEINNFRNTAQFLLAEICLHRDLGGKRCNV